MRLKRHYSFIDYKTASGETAENKYLLRQSEDSE